MSPTQKIKPIKGLYPFIRYKGYIQKINLIICYWHKTFRKSKKLQDNMES